MVVPLPDLRHISGHAANISVHQVVAVAAPKLVQSLGHLTDLIGDNVGPQCAVCQLDLGLDRPVSIDGVTTVQEKVGVDLAHLLIDLHATPGFIDAPTLAGGVAAPGEAHITACFGTGHRRQAQMTGQGLRQDSLVVQVLQHHAVKNFLASRQPD